MQLDKGVDMNLHDTLFKRRLRAFGNAHNLQFPWGCCFEMGCVTAQTSYKLQARKETLGDNYGAISFLRPN